jgi:hypothetical protein
LLVIVSHDAGGAEVLSSFARRLAEPCRYVLAGPAVAIFEKKLGHCPQYTLEKALDGCHQILTGTSWASDIELQAIKIARERGIRTASFLDHWVNYVERFQHRNISIMPDEIWVGDEVALQMARSLFTAIPLKLVPNPYFEDIRETLADMQKPSSSVDIEPYILYLCEPVREHARKEFGDDYYWGYTEESALEYFLSNRHVLESGTNRLLIRPHPSESTGKYQWATESSGAIVSISSGKTLLEDIAPAAMVVGCESTAMVIGLISGKQVVSCIPPGGRPCSLPHPDIRHLQEMVAATDAKHA